MCITLANNCSDQACLQIMKIHKLRKLHKNSRICLLKSKRKQENLNILSLFLVDHRAADHEATKKWKEKK